MSDPYFHNMDQPYDGVEKQQHVGDNGYNNGGEAVVDGIHADGAAAANSSADDAATAQTIRDHLEMCTEFARELGIIVSDVQPQSQALINSKITGIVTELAELDRLKMGYAEHLMVPRDVLEFVDAGKNPECYTFQAMSKAVTENDHARERIDSYRRFKAIMLLELSRLFPKEMQNYKSLRRDCLNA